MSEYDREAQDAALALIIAKARPDLAADAMATKLTSSPAVRHKRLTGHIAKVLAETTVWTEQERRVLEAGIAHAPEG